MNSLGKQCLSPEEKAGFLLSFIIKIRSSSRKKRTGKFPCSPLAKTQISYTQQLLSYDANPLHEKHLSELNPCVAPGGGKGNQCKYKAHVTYTVMNNKVLGL